MSKDSCPGELLAQELELQDRLHCGRALMSPTPRCEPGIRPGWLNTGWRERGRPPQGFLFILRCFPSGGSPEPEGTSFTDKETYYVCSKMYVWFFVLYNDTSLLHTYCVPGRCCIRAGFFSLGQYSLAWLNSRLTCPRSQHCKVPKQKRLAEAGILSKPKARMLQTWHPRGKRL